MLRGEALDGVPGVRIVTPLLIAGEGPAVLVERGFLPAPDAVTVDARGAEEPGELTVRGIALPVPQAAASRSARRDHDVAAAGPAGALRAAPVRVLPIYIRQIPTASCRGSRGGSKRRRWTRGRT